MCLDENGNVKQGSLTRIEPEGTESRLWEAIETYMQRQQPLIINRRNGEQIEVSVTCRLDTAEEVSVYQAGGVLQRFAQDFLESTAVA